MSMHGLNDSQWLKAQWIEPYEIPEPQGCLHLGQVEVDSGMVLISSEGLHGLIDANEALYLRAKAAEERAQRAEGWRAAALVMFVAVLAAAALELAR